MNRGVCAFCRQRSYGLNCAVCTQQNEARNIWLCVEDAPMLTRYESMVVRLDGAWQLVYVTGRIA